MSQGQWPAGRPIELIVGLAPGGGADVMLRALAAMGEKRWEQMSNVPTFGEEGVDVVMASERGLAKPRGIPDEIAARLERAVARVMAKPEWLEKAKQLELPLAYLPGAEWEARMPAQEARCRRIWEATSWNCAHGPRRRDHNRHRGMPPSWPAGRAVPWVLRAIPRGISDRGRCCAPT